MPRQILEHDDSADEGDPKSSAPAGRKAEKMGELRDGDDDRRGVGSGPEEVRGEDDADGQEGDSRQESRSPSHRREELGLGLQFRLRTKASEREKGGTNEGS